MQRVAFFLSTILIALSFAGCRQASNVAGQQGASPQQASQQKVQEQARVRVYEDEAMPKGAQAILGGTIVNTTGERLENLSVELELRRRKDQTIERRSLKVEPQSLAPGERGRYSLSIPKQEWSGSRLVRLRSSSRAEDVPYQTEVGARRPPERIPESRTKVVNVPKPRPRQGEEFINTPDNPERIP